MFARVHAPAFAAGCTVILKPSEIAPLSAMIIAEIMHESKIPAGMFNLVNGLGNIVGESAMFFEGTVADDNDLTIKQPVFSQPRAILLPDEDGRFLTTTSTESVLEEVGALRIGSIVEGFGVESTCVTHNFLLGVGSVAVTVAESCRLRHIRL